MRTKKLQSPLRKRSVKPKPKAPAPKHTNGNKPRQAPGRNIGKSNSGGN